MTIWWLLLILLAIFAGGSAFIWLAIQLSHMKKPAKGGTDTFQDAAEEDVEHIFNEEFREELRNRGRLHFEKILGENAMFLQQDLRLTTSQLNDYMKGEISKELKDAFANYQNAITDAKALAVESIEKTKTAIDEERKSLVGQLENEVKEEKERRIKQFDARMAQVVNHYVLAAIGNQIDLNDQLEYILAELEANKASIIEDIRSGT
jgi:F0F1-type ATP synthase membrane subunit b/b'